jgi:glycyl-tRNA synthetase beta chain
MHKVLFEIGLEEVPARFVDTCMAELKKALVKQLESHRLTEQDTIVHTYATYRRFTLIIDNIKPAQDPINAELQGPPLAIAKNDAGDWLPPAIGFAKKCGVDVSDLFSLENAKGQQVLAAKHNDPGQDASVLLPSILTTIVTQMPLPIAMTWGNCIGPFIRPIQWICALYNDTVIPVELFYVPSGNSSYGHRFLSDANPDSAQASLGAELTIQHPDNYIQTLQDAHVMVDTQQRKDHIHTQLKADMPNQEVDAHLLNEVTQLAEWPTVLPIDFSESFLELPTEVLTQCLRKHQKAFVQYADGIPTNTCMVIADSVTDQNKATVIKGNQQVMLARLNDAQFFWSEDLKKQGFTHWNEQLKHVVFQDGLGSMADKVERIGHIAHTICDQLNIEKPVRDLIARSAFRCKADLVSNMVSELPSLQGVMGSYYAIRFNEVPDVAMAIRDHYQPRSEGDRLPETTPATILAIADRVDTIVSCFENNAIPTGSRDPWGIRRAMIAITNMVLQNQLNLNITQLIEDATITLGKNIGPNTQACLDFFNTRIQTVLSDKGVPQNMLKLFYAGLLTQPLVVAEQAQTLVQLKEDTPEKFTLLLDTTTRVANIIQTEQTHDTVDAKLFSESIESDLYQSFKTLTSQQPILSITPNSLPPVLSFCHILSSYFEQVLINDNNPDVAKNRQALMQQVNRYFLTVGNWEILQK